MFGLKDRPESFLHHIFYVYTPWPRPFCPLAAGDRGLQSACCPRHPGRGLCCRPASAAGPEPPLARLCKETSCTENTGGGWPKEGETFSSPVKVCLLNQRFSPRWLSPRIFTFTIREKYFKWSSVASNVIWQFNCLYKKIFKPGSIYYFVWPRSH